ncbi:2-keto-4-pentenoate hydratase [Facklamia lactis]|uniref:2-keto-4-pentenoate hydratase n=1 Tax=Facklamia lactis TaxID=2749967 RepID=UPI0018CDFBA3|nr:fumarylacetoacetate hydrolase family protein [Facklamia lactis]MBG9980335.1 fumarylacetoacetate hydrolase family protein [Facklamia lactis]
MEKSRINFLSERLLSVYETLEAIEPLTQMEPDLTVDDAYAVQLEFVTKKLDQGHKIVGKKIGLTSKAMQESLGVNEPDYGHLFEEMVVDPQNPIIKKKQVLQARVEGELAFVLKEDLTGPGVTVDQVLRATNYIVAAIEIVDSRIADWRIKLEDTVADNGSSAFYILGKNKFSPNDLDRIGVKMDLYKNSELINSGTGADVLGDSAYCVAWLANKLHDYGIKLQAGEVILAGALSAAVPAKSGDKFVCQFTENLGDVSIIFE